MDDDDDDNSWRFFSMIKWLAFVSPHQSQGSLFIRKTKRKQHYVMVDDEY